MTNQEQVKNIIAFFSVMFGEKEFINDIINMPPDYLIEKFIRYIKSTNPESDWGLHPSLRKDVFDVYCDKWKIPCGKEHDAFLNHNFCKYDDCPFQKIVHAHEDESCI